MMPSIDPAVMQMNLAAFELQAESLKTEREKLFEEFKKMPVPLQQERLQEFKERDYCYRMREYEEELLKSKEAK